MKMKSHKNKKVLLKKEESGSEGRESERRKEESKEHKRTRLFLRMIATRLVMEDMILKM